MVNLLLENYVDARVQDCNMQTALHLACIKGDLEIYKAITARNPFCKNCIDKNKKTPLDLAQANSHY